MTKEDTQKAKAAIETLVDAVNGYRPEEVGDILFDVLTHSHRTLQQSLLGALKHGIERYGELDECWTDLRNETAWRWAKEVRKLAESPSRTLPGRFPLY